MAKDTRKLPGLPAMGGGNRKNPALNGKLPTPTTHKSTYGAGDGQGGGGVQAGGGGNRKNPALGGKLPMPTNHDSYNPPVS